MILIKGIVILFTPFLDIFDNQAWNWTSLADHFALFCKYVPEIGKSANKIVPIISKFSVEWINEPQ